MEWKYVTLYPADNTMIDVELLRFYVMHSEKEWAQIWMEAKTFLH